MIFRAYIEADTRLLVLEAKDGQSMKYHQRDQQHVVKQLWGRKERHFTGTFDPSTRLITLNPNPID